MPNPPVSNTPIGGQVLAQHAAAVKAGNLTTPIPSAVNIQVPISEPFKEEDVKPVNAPLTGVSGPVRILETPIAGRHEKNNPLLPGNIAKTQDELANKSMVQEQETQGDWSLAIDHLNQCYKKSMQRAGSPGCNPFLWKNEVMQPLVDRYERGERSPELYQAMLNVQVPNKPNTNSKGGPKILPAPVKK